MKKLFLLALAITSTNILPTTHRSPRQTVFRAIDTFQDHVHLSNTPIVSALPIVTKPNHPKTKDERINSAVSVFRARMAQEADVPTNTPADIQPPIALSTDQMATGFAIATEVINSTIERFNTLAITQNNQ